MKKKSESFRTIGHISWQGIPIEMQMTKKRRAALSGARQGNQGSRPVRANRRLSQRSESMKGHKKR
ncbi:hypothetical protein [uncultured Dubosiella sp.]|uniref:hypothetical protein n=1 Tax=uncultured Dubosiella sp. TaxID=1937011 RepID=UPI0027312E69|nr:hypothetical protein [uncultured Dubosiella sp.]